MGSPSQVPFGVFKHPVVEASFRLYHWRDSFDLILLDWTPLDVQLAQDVSYVFNFTNSVPDDIFSGQNLNFLPRRAILSQLFVSLRSCLMIVA